MSSIDVIQRPAIGPHPSRSAPASSPSGLAVALATTYAGLAYVGFLGVFSYAVGFLHDAVVPKSIDDGPVTPFKEAITVNAALLGAFAIQHTIMARQGFKRWLARVAPGLPERSTFVLAAASLLALLYWQWRPMPGVVWNLDTPWVRAVVISSSLLGFALVVLASFQIDHFHLFGLRQIRDRIAGRTAAPPRFSATGLYRHVRHPLMLGFLVAFWAAPTMTIGRLVFAGLVTAYVLIGTRIEERDLIRELGEPYLRYRRSVPAIVPRPWRGAPPSL